MPRDPSGFFCSFGLVRGMFGALLGVFRVCFGFLEGLFRVCLGMFRASCWYYHEYSQCRNGWGVEGCRMVTTTGMHALPKVDLQNVQR